MDWGNPLQSAYENVMDSQYGWLVNPVEKGLSTQGLDIGSALGWSASGKDSGGGQNWFGYMPEYLKEADVSLKNLMGGGAPSDPYIKKLQDIYKQNIQGAQAERGGFYGGKAIEEEASGMSQIYQQAANQQMQNYLNYLGLARPQALTPQAQQPGFGSYLGQGLGSGLAMSLPLLLAGL